MGISLTSLFSSGKKLEDMPSIPVQPTDSRVKIIVKKISESYIGQVVRSGSIEENVFTIGQARDMCEVLGLDYDNFPGSTVAEAIRRYRATID